MFNNLFNLGDVARSNTTLLVGLIGVLLAALGVLSHFMSFISLLTITITPIAGVMISDYFISKTYKNYKTLKKFSFGHFTHRKPWRTPDFPNVTLAYEDGTEKAITQPKILSEMVDPVFMLFQPICHIL